MKVQIKVQSHRETIQTTLNTVLMDYYFKCFKKLKMLRPRRIEMHHILLYGNPILTNKRTLKDWFYLEMLSHRAINDNTNSLERNTFFLFFDLMHCHWLLLIIKVAATDIRYFAKSKFSRSLVQKNYFSLIWLVFKLGLSREVG